MVEPRSPPAPTRDVHRRGSCVPTWTLPALLAVLSLLAPSLPAQDAGDLHVVDPFPLGCTSEVDDAFYLHVPGQARTSQGEALEVGDLRVLSPGTTASTGPLTAEDPAVGEPLACAAIEITWHDTQQDGEVTNEDLWILQPDIPASEDPGAAWPAGVAGITLTESELGPPGTPLEQGTLPRAPATDRPDPRTFQVVHERGPGTSLTAPGTYLVAYPLDSTLPLERAGVALSTWPSLADPVDGEARQAAVAAREAAEQARQAADEARLTAGEALETAEEAQAILEINLEILDELIEDQRSEEEATLSGAGKAMLALTAALFLFLMSRSIGVR
ncbi:MAG: hypothetical protein R3185_02005 [Candidatus Thermoplasmatota archaeon]|nr:hypothetical protein [Candidatus Thermoplasmatota archaeon]